MKRTSAQLRNDALAIWQAGVDAVRSDRLVEQNVRVLGDALWIDELELPLAEINRIAVIGAGKAGAGMAAGLEAALGSRLLDEKQVHGWLNVPADCVRPLAKIHLHAARPAGVNEPTEEGVRGATEILRIVSALGPRDLCLCLLSGGGSALLPAPAAGVSLAEKQAITRFLSGAGANIQQLNTVRKQLSQVKGGRLAAACRAGRLVTLTISDVIGDPLDVIASGPTVPDTGTPQQALAVLEEFGAVAAGIAPQAVAYLQSATERDAAPPLPTAEVHQWIIGNNAVAVDAAGVEAERRGYSHAMLAARELEGPAEEVGRRLAEMAVRMRDQAGPDCLITGGEPIVRLAPAELRGRGGRNQQLTLAALARLLELAPRSGPELAAAGIALLAGGTDGEDGPTDAAGAWLDESLVREMIARGLDPTPYLQRNDAYRLFEPLGGLIKTGPTHTNVCDVRVVVVDRIEQRS